jgi:hypothetical protein
MAGAIFKGAVALAVLATAACAASNKPLALADRLTRAAYTGDVATIRSTLAPNVRTRVTPASVAQLKARMRRYGTYEGLRSVSEIPAERRYDFEAEFTTGSMLVQLRLDEHGAVAAYRVIPNEVSAGLP